MRRGIPTSPCPRALSSENSYLVPHVRIPSFGADSYLKQIFKVIVAAQSVESVEFGGGGWAGTTSDNTHVCSGSSEAAAPRCKATYNCRSGDYEKFHLANGATLTGVFNFPPYQHRLTKDDAGARSVGANLTEFIRDGAGAAGAFTHALVMEPHGFNFFDFRALSVKSPNHARDWNEVDRKEWQHGCGWSDIFWEVWNREMPNKVCHTVR